VNALEVRGGEEVLHVAGAVVPLPFPGETAGGAMHTGAPHRRGEFAVEELEIVRFKGGDTW
jgi:hypothetical protein